MLIYPEVKPQLGDCVLARFPDQQVLFRKYKVKGLDGTGQAVFELVPLNEDHPVMSSDEHPLS